MKRIIVLVLLVLIVGCTKTEYYDTAEEAWSQEYSGDIKDLRFCDLTILNNNGENFWFPFIGLKNIDECLNIMNHCYQVDRCTWRVDTGAGNTNDRGWEPKHTGRCVCRFNN